MIYTKSDTTRLFAIDGQIMKQVEFRNADINECFWVSNKRWNWKKVIGIHFYWQAVKANSTTEATFLKSNDYTIHENCEKNWR